MTEASSSEVTVSDYVRDTLSEIIAGVRAAQELDGGEMVGRSPTVTTDMNISSDLQGNTVMLVRFDLATTVEQKQQGKVGASVKVVALGGFEGGGEKSMSSAAISRVSFVIPMAVPRPEGQRSDDAATRERRRIARGGGVQIL